MVRIEYVVTAKGGFLPARSSVLRYFSRVPSGQQFYRRPVDPVKVECIVDGFLVSLSCPVWPDIRSSKDGHLLRPSDQKIHTIEGHQVQVDLLCPDVYGCQVSVTPGRVEVNVGSEVTDNIMQTDEERHRFIQKFLSWPYPHFVHFRRSGHIAVTLVSTLPDCRKLAWEYLAVFTLIEMLYSYQQLLPKRPRPIQDRYIDLACETVRSRTMSYLDTPENTIMVLNIAENTTFHFFESMFSHDLQERYPEVKFSVVNLYSQVTELEGPTCAVDDAEKYICNSLKNVSKKDIIITWTQGLMMGRLHVQERFDEILAREKITCYWTLNRAARRDYLLFGFKNNSITVAAIESDHPKIEQLFRSFIWTTTITLDSCQVSYLQSDTWKIFLDDIQKPRDDKPAPVLEVNDDTITIVDLSEKIEATRTAVLEFSYENLKELHKELCFLQVEDFVYVHPWHLKFLGIPQVISQLSSNLGFPITVDHRAGTVSIKALEHLKSYRLLQIMKYINCLSCLRVKLTPASAEMYKKPSARQWVQKLLDKEALLCHWQMEEGEIAITAEHAHQQKLSEVFESAFVETDFTVDNQSSLLRSGKFQALVETLQKAKKEEVAPVVVASTAGDHVTVVDTPDRSPVTVKAIVSFINDHIPECHTEWSPCQPAIQTWQDEDEHELARQQQETKTSCAGRNLPEDKQEEMKHSEMDTNQFDDELCTEQIVQQEGESLSIQTHESTWDEDRQTQGIWLQTEEVFRQSDRKLVEDKQERGTHVQMEELPNKTNRNPMEDNKEETTQPQTAAVNNVYENLTDEGKQDLTIQLQEEDACCHRNPAEEEQKQIMHREAQALSGQMVGNMQDPRSQSQDKWPQTEETTNPYYGESLRDQLGETTPVTTKDVYSAEDKHKQNAQHQDEVMFSQTDENTGEDKQKDSSHPWIKRTGSQAGAEDKLILVEEISSQTSNNLTEDKQQPTEQPQTEEVSCQADESLVDSEEDKRAFYNQTAMYLLDEEKQKPHTEELSIQTDRTPVEEKQEQTMQTQAKETFCQSGSNLFEDKEEQTPHLQTADVSNQTDRRNMVEDKQEQTVMLQTEDATNQTDRHLVEDKQQQTTHYETEEVSSQTEDSLALDTTRYQSNAVQYGPEPLQAGSLGLQENRQLYARDGGSHSLRSGNVSGEPLSETFVKDMVQPQQTEGGPVEDSDAPQTQDPTTAWHQHLTLLTVDQLLEISSHLGLSEHTPQHLHCRRVDAETLRRNLMDTCRAADLTVLCTFLLQQYVRNGCGIEQGPCSSQTSSLSLPAPIPETAADHVQLMNFQNYHGQSAAHLPTAMERTLEHTAPHQHVLSYLPPSYADPGIALQTPLAVLPLNSVDPINLYHCTQAESTAIAGSTRRSLEDTRESSDELNTPMIGIRRLSSSSPTAHQSLPATDFIASNPQIPPLFHAATVFPERGVGGQDDRNSQTVRTSEQRCLESEPVIQEDMNPRGAVTNHSTDIPHESGTHDQHAEGATSQERCQDNETGSDTDASLDLRANQPPNAHLRRGPQDQTDRRMQGTEVDQSPPERRESRPPAQLDTHLQPTRVSQSLQRCTERSSALSNNTKSQSVSVHQTPQESSENGSIPQAHTSRGTRDRQPDTRSLAGRARPRMPPERRHTVVANRHRAEAVRQHVSTNTQPPPPEHDAGRRRPQRSLEDQRLAVPAVQPTALPAQQHHALLNQHYSELQSRMEVQMRQMFHQMEIQMLDRVDALVQVRQQSARVAESRVYLNHMQALQQNVQQQMGGMQAEMRAIRQQMNTDILGVVFIDNMSDSSPSVTPSEVSE